ncbi:MAG: hypothetical protein WCX83_06630 [Candidatus Cloacimonas sp.]|nr:hypothetical protein [Candidatus Cloacimonadota bacterium]
MPIIEKPDYSQKRAIPNTIKLVLLIAVIFGIYMRSCYNKKRDIYYVVSDIELAEQTLSSVDVLFVVQNTTEFAREETFLIKIYTDRGDEIASKIVALNIDPSSKKKYRKIIDSWERGLYEGEQLSHATVEIFKAKVF